MDVGYLFLLLATHLETKAEKIGLGDLKRWNRKYGLSSLFLGLQRWTWNDDCEGPI
jgi:hypothetical protein